jgi:general secretion pathway protein J
MAGRRASFGFTLVELLVALFAMSLLALMSWRGLDSMVRVQQQTQARADEVLALQVGLEQWAADLDAVVRSDPSPAMEWNGRVLRLTRRSTAAATDGLLVVAWTRRNGPAGSQWLRWQSAPVTTRGELEQAWQRAEVWSNNPGDEERRNEVAITPLADWQLFYYRGNAWTNPLSSDATGGAPRPPGPGGLPEVSTTQLPDGVRLVLRLPPGGALTGDLVRDWARPTLGGVRA